MSEVRAYVKDQGILYGATIHVGSSITCNATMDRYGNSAAFVQKANGKWRCIEWLIVPDEVKTALFNRAEAKEKVA
jgi:hypothetical protein